MPYGWIRIGEQYGLRSSKAGKVNVFGLMNLRGDLTSYTNSGQVNSTTIIDCLDDFASTIKKKTVVILDNAPWHTSALVNESIEHWKSLGLHLFYLPPYCPHLNKIETLWRKMKHEWLRPEDYNSVEKLHARILEILTNFGKNLFKINFNETSC